VAFTNVVITQSDTSLRTKCVFGACLAKYPVTWQVSLSRTIARGSMGAGGGGIIWEIPATEQRRAVCHPLPGLFFGLLTEDVCSTFL
jgi:hypothetical protein